MLPGKMLAGAETGVRSSVPVSEWPVYAGGEGLLLLGRDVVDQQIIDVHGRKVVRVNDVDLHEGPQRPSSGVESGRRQRRLPRRRAAPAERRGARPALRSLLRASQNAPSPGSSWT